MYYDNNGRPWRSPQSNIYIIYLFIYLYTHPYIQRYRIEHHRKYHSLITHKPILRLSTFSALLFLSLLPICLFCLFAWVFGINYWYWCESNGNKIYLRRSTIDINMNDFHFHFFLYQHQHILTASMWWDKLRFEQLWDAIELVVFFLFCKHWHLCLMP